MIDCSNIVYVYEITPKCYYMIVSEKDAQWTTQTRFAAQGWRERGFLIFVKGYVIRIKIFIQFSVERQDSHILQLAVLSIVGKIIFNKKN